MKSEMKKENSMKAKPDIPVPSKRCQAVYCRRILERRPIEEVMAEFNIHRRTVIAYIYRMRRFLRQVSLGRAPHIFDHAFLPGPMRKEVHLARLDHLWQETLEAWNRSLEPEQTEKVIQERRPGSKSGAKPQEAEAEAADRERGERTRRSRSGDARYLIQARTIMEEIRLLRGNNQWSFGEEESDVERRTLDERAAIFDQVYQVFYESAREAEDAGTAVRADAPRRAA
jgi:hypothetical protein